MRNLFLVLFATLVLVLPSVAAADEEAAARDGHEFLGITVHPFTALAFDSLRGPDQWASGFKFGLEVDVSEGGYFSTSLTLHDILTNEDDSAYDYDSTLRLELGWYW